MESEARMIVSVVALAALVILGCAAGCVTETITTLKNGYCQVTVQGSSSTVWQKCD